MLTIYTDGAISYKQNIGGWAAIVLNNQDQKTTTVAGYQVGATNNKMELEAALQGLSVISDITDDLAIEVELISDSEYVVKGSSIWLPGWINRNWKSSTGPVKNKDQWERINTFVKKYPNLKFSWVRGHAGDKYNEICDKLAVGQYKQFEKTDEDDLTD